MSSIKLNLEIKEEIASKGFSAFDSGDYLVQRSKTAGCRIKVCSLFALTQQLQRCPLEVFLFLALILFGGTVYAILVKDLSKNNTMKFG